MLTAISSYNMWVTDQDQALTFYVDTLGMQVVADQDLGFMRWLTVAPTDRPDQQLILCSIDRTAPEQQRSALRELVAAGLAGIVILVTDDCRATYADLVAKGVTSRQEPTELPYGIDCAFADPFGNQIRITQPAATQPAA